MIRKPVKFIKSDLCFLKHFITMLSSGLSPGSRESKKRPTG